MPNAFCLRKVIKIFDYHMKRIVALVPNVLDWSPGQRVRIESWAKHLVEYGWQVDIRSFESDSLHEILYKEGNIINKAVKISQCYLSQLKFILQKPSCDILFIYREASLIGPAIIERLAKRLKVPIVYDFDDPIFLTDLNSVNKLFSRLKFPKKTHTIFDLSDHIIAINDIMGNYAREFNPNVSVVPNFVDTERFCPAHKTDEAVRLGWSGSFSTMHNLKAIASPLQKLQEKYNVPIRVIGNGDIKIKNVNLEIRQWSPQTEVSDLQDCSIGLMPLAEHPGNKWKFFLKVIQYLAVGLPVVAQQGGSNSDVIKDGVNGFVVKSQDEWYDRLSLLIEDTVLRQKMSQAARQTALDCYSTHVQMNRVADIFENVLAQFNIKK